MTTSTVREQLHKYIDNLPDDIVQQIADFVLFLMARRGISSYTETLIPSSASQESKPLQFGKYKGNKMSSLEDFAIAEWRPTDKELNGG